MKININIFDCYVQNARLHVCIRDIGISGIYLDMMGYNRDSDVTKFIWVSLKMGENGLYIPYNGILF